MQAHLEDSAQYQKLRKVLSGLLQTKGVSDPAVLRAIETVPRHFFFDPALLQHAYQDKAFPIGEGQTISQPYTVAFQTQLLSVKKGDKILEIGTGSGYQAAILAEMGATLYSVEYNRTLFERAKHLLTQLDYPVHLFCGDGSMGLPVHAPFDRILVTAGAPLVPKTLVNQLVTGGVLVIPVGDASRQRMMRVTRLENHDLRTETYQHFNFVPLVGKNGWK